MSNVYTCIIQNDKPSAWVDTLRHMPVVGSPLCDRFLFASTHVVNERSPSFSVDTPLETAGTLAEYSVLASRFASIPFDTDLHCDEAINPESPTGVNDVFHADFDIDMEKLFGVEESTILDLIELDWL
jgi:hypothetical protein